jgi:hypothetical protein
MMFSGLRSRWIKTRAISVEKLKSGRPLEKF